MSTKISEGISGSAHTEGQGNNRLVLSVTMRQKGIPQSEAAYAEDAHLQWWYFDATFQEGHRLLTYFLPAFRGTIGDQPPDQPYLNVVLKKPDGEIVRGDRSFPSSEFN